MSAHTDPSTPATASVRVVGLVEDFLDDLATRTHRRLGDVAGVAITMATTESGPFTAGASTRMAREVDALQYAIGRGPCLHALEQGHGDYVPDLGADDRWGPYGPRAAALGARSCQSVPVCVDDRVLAVAKIYSGRVDGLSLEQRRIGDDFGTEAAGGIGLAQSLAETANELDDRQAAMQTRRTIDLAVGKLMERAQVDADAAFALLRRFSQTRNVKLRDVAAEVVGGPSGSDSGNEAAAPFFPRSDRSGA